MTEDEKRQEQAALDYAKQHRRALAKRLTNTSTYPPDEQPVSVFMAGSPGAGKTEASLELLASFQGPLILRIDADELRREIPGYTGNNAWLFQRAVSVLVEKIHDKALEQNQSFLLDGTLSHYDKARKNLERSLGRGRAVQILYVYQEPLLAWQFVLAREALEGRNIKKETFINQYFNSRDTVNRLKQNFGKDIRVDLLLKNRDNSRRLYKANIDRMTTTYPKNTIARPLKTFWACPRVDTMKLFSKSKPRTSSAFSEFIRNASSEEKKKVYTKVIERASERQNAVVSSAHTTPRS